MTKAAYYPDLYQQHKAEHRYPPMIESVKEEGACLNCGGKRFVVAFFPDRDKTQVVGRVPITPKGKVLKWLPASGDSEKGGWLTGFNRVYDCPVCN